MLSNDIDRVGDGDAQYTLLTNEDGRDRRRPHRLPPGARPVLSRRQRVEPPRGLRLAEGAGASRLRGARRLRRVRPARGAGTALARAARARRRRLVHARDGRARRRRGDDRPHGLHGRDRAWSCCCADDDVDRALGRRDSRAASSRAVSARATRFGSRSATRCTATTSPPETDAISAGLGWACALETEFTGAERSAGSRRTARSASSSRS